MITAVANATASDRWWWQATVVTAHSHTRERVPHTHTHTCWHMHNIHLFHLWLILPVFCFVCLWLVPERSTSLRPSCYELFLATAIFHTFPRMNFLHTEETAKAMANLGSVHKITNRKLPKQSIPSNENPKTNAILKSYHVILFWMMWISNMLEICMFLWLYKQKWHRARGSPTPNRTWKGDENRRALWRDRTLKHVAYLWHLHSSTTNWANWYFSRAASDVRIWPHLKFRSWSKSYCAGNKMMIFSVCANCRLRWLAGTNLPFFVHTLLAKNDYYYEFE